MNNKIKYCVCICTFKRPTLLSRLIDDLLKQALLPDAIIVVDGDPNSNQVKGLLVEKQNTSAQLIYIPANHANQAYQRYLGFRVAQLLETGYIVYFDDDLRIKQENCMEQLLIPFNWENHEVVGVTAYTKRTKDSIIEYLPYTRRHSRLGTGPIFKRWGAFDKLSNGGLSVTGQRRQPVRDDKNPAYGRVQWLQGRVMAFRVDILSSKCFSDDYFAMGERFGGLAEDTYISLKVRSYGEIWFAFDLNIEHPDDAPPNSYPISAYRYGLAYAYSRRYVNDNFRGFAPPTISDRIYLVSSYLGISLLNWIEVMTTPRANRFAYAIGYGFGALKGVFQKPTAKRLTPNINWYDHAEKAVANMFLINQVD